MGTNEHAVAIVGAGPAGMVLAAELALADVDAVVLERRPDHGLAGSRGGGLHARSIELLDQRGVADRFLAAGQVAQAAMLANTVLDMGDVPTRHPYSLGLWQNEIERLLGEWVTELGVPIRHGVEVTGVVPGEDGVTVALAGGSAVRARYVVGCDGGRSLVRRAAGIAFPGSAATISNLIAEVETTEQPELGRRHDALGVHGIGRLDYEIRDDGEIVFASDGPVRVMVTEPELGASREPTLDELRAVLVRVYGTDFGVHSPTWLSRFTDATRHAETYRAGRLLLAGDAAHVHYPAGGQGIGLGLQDAVNLGWKLARVVHGTSPEALLDTYERERHPVTARALRHTMAQAALGRPDERSRALAEVVSELATMDEPRRRVAGTISGLDVRYDLGDGHPLLGRRTPDLDLEGADGPFRVFSLLHRARPVLLDLTGEGAVAPGPWAGEVRLVAARHDGGDWELPVIGAVPAPAAVLIRPDGHVAWVGDGTDAGLHEALATWFGPAAPGTDPPIRG